jgi:hypothetical protein
MVAETVMSPFVGVEKLQGNRPYLRRYGTTRFLSAATQRNAQPAAVAVDVINFMDALKINRANSCGERHES